MKKTQKFTNMIQLNAESLGIKSLDNEIIDYLNVEIEEKMKLILLQAQKFIRISKRKTLKVDDLGHSLKLYNIDEPIGYDSYSMIDYEKIDTVKGLWRMKQNVIDIEDYLSKPMAIYPMQPFPHFYWFAIEGKRPDIPENFIRNENQNQDNQKIKHQKSQNNYLIELEPSSENNAKEENDINNNNDNNESIKNNNSNKINENNENGNIINQNNDDNINGFGLNNNNKEDMKKINHVIHNISKELQIFFENFKQRFKNEMNGNTINNRPYLYLSKDMQMSIDIIKTNPGIVELVPYIINFLMNYFEKFSYDIKICHCILHYINSIINNQSFFLEPYLHQILIVILSFILYENDKNNLIYLDPIIRFKLYAIKILEQIIFKYFIKYHDLQFQLVQVFIDNICFGEKEKENYLKIFGAIEGLKMIGPVFTKKAFEKKGLIEDKNINKDFEQFLISCKNDKEICDNLKNIVFRNKDFNEENIRVNNENPIFSNIDTFFKNDFNKRKKLALFYSYQTALMNIANINT